MRITNPLLTRDDIENAIDMYWDTEDGTPNGVKTYAVADILKMYPNLEESQLQRYLQNPSLIGNLRISEAVRVKIVNLVRTGLKYSAIAEHERVSIGLVQRAALHIRRSDGIQEIYGDPDYEANQI